jgi:inner membrane protein
MCHVVLLLPIFALPLFLFLPWELALIAYVAVAVVSAALYWLLWRTMQRPAARGIEGMVGGVGTVFRLRQDKMKVFYQGEIWDAVSEDRVSLGERVEITGLDHMELVVRRRA